MNSSKLLKLHFYTILVSALIVGTGCSSSSDGTENTPPDDQGGADINTSNYTTLLELIFSVANTEAINELPKTIETIYGDDIYGVPDGLDFLSEISSSYDQEALVVNHVYACNEGGIYTFREPGSSFGGGSGEFDACQFDGVVHNGSYSRYNELVKYVYSTGWAASTSYHELTSSSDSSENAIEGTIDLFNGANENNENWSITRFTHSTSTGELIVTDATIRLYVGDQPENPDYTDGWKRSFSSTFTVQAPQTKNIPMTVTTEERFVSRDKTDTYSSGILKIQAADGSEMRVVADNGDPATFQADITSNDTVSSFTLPWEGELRLRCLNDPESADVLSDACR